MANIFASLRNFLRRTRHNSQQKPRQASILHQIMFNIILVVIVTVIFSGVPAILLLRFQLEQLAFLHVQNAQSATIALYGAEKNRMLKLVELSSERPTLIGLVGNSNVQELTQYLDSLREVTSADFLGFINLDFELTHSGTLEILFPESYPTSHSMPFVDLISLKDPTRVAIVAINEIKSKEGSTPEILGWVVCIQILDDEFMQILSQQTGLEQSIILGGHRVATSFSNFVDWPLDPEAISVVTHTHSSSHTMGSSENETFFVGMAPLTDDQGQVVAVSEVALPGETILNKTQTAIAYKIGTSIVIALLGVALAVVLTRRITRPLLNLARSAERMGFGDLNTQIPISSGWIEIDQLAAQLERSRKYLNQMLFFTRSELKRITHLLGATKEGVVVLNEDGDITWFNLEVSRIMGYRPMDLFHKHHSQIFRPSGGDVPPLDEALVMSGNQRLRKHLTVLNAQDHPITLSVSTSQLDLEDGKGEHSEFVLTLRDISKEPAVTRLRNEFLTFIAHEFRTPLASISAVIELLEEECYSMTGEEISKLVSTIRLSSSHLSTLVDNLLESTIIEAGCFQLNYKTIRLDNLLNSVYKIMTPLVNRHQQTLEFQTPKYLPTIWADPDRLAQALVNLLQNASKFSQFGALIMLKVQIQKDYLLFSVLDSGPGLSEGEFSDLFNHIIVSDQPRGARFGIGLGLPVVKSIVEAHGGEVGAENRPEGGARIWFTLPLNSKGAQEGELWQRYSL